MSPKTVSWRSVVGAQKAILSVATQTIQIILDNVSFVTIHNTYASANYTYDYYHTQIIHIGYKCMFGFAAENKCISKNNNKKNKKQNFRFGTVFE